MGYTMNNKGITIIELIFVLLIIGIIISIALPKLDFSDYELKVYGRQLVNDLNEIKTRSQMEGNGANNTITLNLHNYHVKLLNDKSKDIYLKSQYSIVNNFSSNKIQFQPNGTPYQAGTILIFNDTNNEYIEITITPGTGRIHMYEKIQKGHKKL